MRPVPRAGGAFASYGAIGCMALIIAPFIALLAMCSSNEDAPVVEAGRPQRFGGLVISGRPPDAKSGGFRDCAVDGSVATCRRGQFQFLGHGVASADAALESPSGSPFDPSAAVFSSVDIAFPNPQAREGFVADLERRGWIRRNWRRYAYLYREHTPVEIQWEPSDGARMTVRPIDRGDADEYVGRSKAALAQRQRETDFTTAMRK